MEPYYEDASHVKEHVMSPEEEITRLRKRLSESTDTLLIIRSHLTHLLEYRTDYEHRAVIEALRYLAISRIDINKTALGDDGDDLRLYTTPPDLDRLLNDYIAVHNPPWAGTTQ